MADLFDSPAPTTAPAAAAPNDVPAYGTLTPLEEHRLYLNEHPRWVAYITPRYLELMNRPGGMAWLAEGFENVMSRALQRAIWAQLSESQQQDITRRVEIIRAERAASKPSSDKDTTQ